MTKERAVIGALRLAPPLTLGLLGFGLWLLSQSQPARLGGAIGPGFMARGLAFGVVGLAALWALSVWREGHSSAGAAPSARPAQRGAGLSLLAGVLAFALAVPVGGLVAGSAFAAGCAAWATGERRVRALAATMAGLAGLTAAIGLMLLPPTAPLWPGG